MTTFSFVLLKSFHCIYIYVWMYRITNSLSSHIFGYRTAGQIRRSFARSLVIQIFMLMNKSTNQRTTTTTTRLNVKQPTHILWCFLFGKCTYKLLLICWIHETKPIWRGLNFDMEQFHTIFLISCRFTTYLLLRMRRSFLFLYQSNKHNCFV